MSPSPWRSRATAALPAVLLIAVDVAVGGNVLRDDTGWRLGGSVAVAVVIGLAVLVRRRWPVPVLVFVLAVSAAAAFLGVLWDPFAGAALVLHVVALGRDRLLPLLGACAVAAVAGVAAWWYVLGVPLLVAAWAAGRAAHAHRAQAEQLELQRQHQIRTDERLRIARELHDVVTHGMGLIAVKAGVANHVAESRPDEAREALRIIEETSREALGEMRRLLSALREDAEPPGELADLPRLAERAASAGVAVELDVDVADLPRPVELAAFRIVQEAVTNVVKHAAPARCRVVVRAHAGEVRIEVTDDGARSPGPVRPGHGIVGMSERAALYGGELTAEPLPHGGFRVAARLRCAPAEVPVA
ncbi:sensor histidine kinase [Amycolatopsis thermoflava]|uniref:histidine kinase n=1 Tax=Amycolatopsis thermoflava TaxID=84480 RepID=A0A3N2GR51_9PSEU|nr:sensor histidine kinase [Amycolatopsis thermoflava]ROS39097.1 signal transduction histidine kinase [Amycolatopsis thermoflava]